MDTTTTTENSGYHGSVHEGTLPGYQTLTSTLHQSPDDSISAIGVRPILLPSSCESPMSLPAFSPPTNPFLGDHRNETYQHQSFSSVSSFNNETIPLATESSGTSDLNLQEFSVEMAVTSSEDDGKNRIDYIFNT